VSAAYDLVIRNGTVVDGSGAAPIAADVAIAGGAIAAIGRVTGRGVEEIDAADKLVTPGFVDVHTHYDGQVTWDDCLAPSSVNGATTVVMGNCGVGFAPCKPEQREMLIALMEGVEDIPGAVLAEGVPWGWETFPEYLDFLERRRCDVDFAAQLPHGPLRVYVMGRRGAEREPANDDDLARMAEIASQAVAAGALGFSTSRTLAHRKLDGTLVPTASVGEDELLAIARAMQSAGRGVIQAIGEFADTTEGDSSEFAMWRRIVAAARRPLALAVGQRHRSGREVWRHLLGLISDAVRDGLPVRAQVAPRPLGVLLGLYLSSHPFVNTPAYRALAHLPLAERVAEMRKPAVRARILADEPDSLNQLYAMRTVGEMVEFVEPLEYFPPEEQKLKVRAAAHGVAPLELAYDLLLQADGRTVLYHPVVNFAESTDAVVGEMLAHPQSVVAAGDGGAHVGMLCDASQSTYLLTYWTRDRRGERFSLPWAIRALTRIPAESVGLLDRGLLVPGSKADLNVIDYDRLRLHAPELVADLPAGGRRLAQRVEGFGATVVSGVVTYRDGTPTGALPGKLVRGRG
jgi:N-acyl-D-aspartate/D-glutamate deacylase